VAFIQYPVVSSGVVTRPDDTASSAEIARWMEEDFWERVTEAAEEAAKNDTSDE